MEELQNDKGEWYFFYWAKNAVDFVEVPKESMESLDTFNEWAKIHGNPNDYTMSTYIKGDAQATFDYCQKLYDDYNKKVEETGENSNPKYSIPFYNCAQASMDALAQSFRGVRMLGDELGSYNLIPVVCQIEVATWVGKEYWPSKP